MKHFNKRLKANNFYVEVKQFIGLSLIVALTYYFYNYGNIISKTVFSDKGMIWAAFCMLSIVLALVIKIYYRMVIIRYYEKSININLFENLRNRP